VFEGSRVRVGCCSASHSPLRRQRVNASPRELRANRDEFAELRTVFDQTKALRTLDGRPLFVLTADVGQQSGWSAAQPKLATLSTNSAHQTTQGATHTALLEDEHYAAESSRAISAVVHSVRTSAPLGG
jgi:hypothetical protein